MFSPRPSRAAPPSAHCRARRSPGGEPLAGSTRASYASENRPARTRPPHAGGNSASASDGTPARRRAACVGRSGGGQSRACSAAVRASCRCAPRRQPLRRWLDRPRASYGRRISPRMRAHNPRRRKFCERFGLHAREAACCLRKAFVRRQTRARSAAVRASRRHTVPAVASAMAGSTKARYSGQNRPARTRRSAPAEILRALRAACPRGGVQLAYGVHAQPDAGAFRGGSGKLPVSGRSQIQHLARTRFSGLIGTLSAAFFSGVSAE